MNGLDRKVEKESRSLLNELRGFDKGGFLDLGHPLLNRIADSFVKSAGIGAIQAVLREAYFTAMEDSGSDSSTDGVTEISGTRKGQPFPYLRGQTNLKSLEAMVKNTGKESFQWGLAAGVYSGLTYGLKEVRGAHDWKNSAVAGAITGVALALTSDRPSHELIAQCAITGAAVSTAANLLSGVF
ncbi:hypothetical protein SAY86_001098 [Trapa natans]|uniref:Outer envelope pore protein 16-2, chloroplastic n=1 Tax=Trapa natans TaxID=22666 RepID=A0AAN7RH89_TRANT|nr:hypothetical protein SAY86_001098 [Trapa natans]